MCTLFEVAGELREGDLFVALNKAAFHGVVK